MDKVLEFLESEEGIESAKKYFGKINDRAKMTEDQIDRLHGKGTFVSLLEKCIEKYESDEYVRKEYKLGYEPREPLYWFLYKYAQKYGRQCSKKEWEKYGNMFSSNLVICEGYIFNQMNGQGSCVVITKI